jgi:hypothetical protein
MLYQYQVSSGTAMLLQVIVEAGRQLVVITVQDSCRYPEDESSIFPKCWYHCNRLHVVAYQKGIILNSSEKSIFLYGLTLSSPVMPCGVILLICS